MSKADIKAGSAYVELMLSDAAFTRGLRSAGKQLRSFGGGMAAVGAGITAAGSALVAPFAAAVKHFADVGSELNDMAARTGVSAQALAELGYAAEQTGTDMAGVEQGLTKMAKFLDAAAGGSKEARKTLADLGTPIATLKGLKPEDQFEAIGAALQNIPNPTDRAAAAMKVLGKSGTTLLPMLENLHEARAEAQALGLAPSDEAVKMADDLGDAFHRVERAAGAVVFSIGEAVAPVVLEATKAITQIVAAAGRWVRQNKALFATVAAVGAGMVAAGLAITGLGLSIVAVGAALSGLASALGAAGAALAAFLSPAGLIVAALVAASVAWARFTQSGQAAVSLAGAALGKLAEIAGSTLGGIREALAGGDLALAAQVGLAGLRVALLAGVASIAEIVGGAWGDFVGKIGSDLAGGDIQGAFSTMATEITAQWAAFAEGLVAIFAEGSKAILNVWQQTTTAISKWLLQNAAKGGIFGKLALLGTGVDFKSEQERSQRIAQRQRELGLATGPDALTEAQNTASGIIGGKADALRAKLDALERGAQGRTRTAQGAARERIRGGAGGASSALAAAEKELADLRNRATEAARSAAEETKREQGTGAVMAGGANNLGDSVMGTFSAAALAASGAGITPMERVAKAAEKQKETLDDIFSEVKRSREATEKAGGLRA